MGQTDLLRLNECASYLIDTERQDFENYLFDGGNAESHIYSTAYIALHGETAFNTHLSELLKHLDIES